MKKLKREGGKNIKILKENSAIHKLEMLTVVSFQSIYQNDKWDFIWGFFIQRYEHSVLFFVYFIRDISSTKPIYLLYSLILWSFLSCFDLDFF